VHQPICSFRYGGGAKRTPNWRRELAARSGTWPERRLQAVLNAVRQWCQLVGVWGEGPAQQGGALLVGWVRECIYSGVSYQLLVDEVAVDMDKIPADAYSFEREFLHFLEVWKAPPLPPASNDQESLMMEGMEEPPGTPPDLSPLPSPRLMVKASAAVGVPMIKAKKEGITAATLGASTRWMSPSTFAVSRSPRLRLNAPPLEVDDEADAAAVGGRIRLGGGRRSPRLPQATQVTIHPEDIPLWRVSILLCLEETCFLRSPR
jgi:hypothetical protein